MLNDLCSYEERKRVRRSFTADEDKALVDYMTLNPNSNWKAVASIFENRTARQCRERWLKNLSFLVKEKVWTFEENTNLVEKVISLGDNWTKIKNYFPERSEEYLKNKWHEIEAKARIHHSSPKENMFACINEDNNSFGVVSPENYSCHYEKTTDNENTIIDEEGKKTVQQTCRSPIDNWPTLHDFPQKQLEKVTSSTTTSKTDDSIENQINDLEKIIDKCILPTTNWFEITFGDSVSPYSFDFEFFKK